jgi:integrase
MSRFSVFQRSGRNFYVQFYDEASGRRLSPRSLGTQDRDQAMFLAGQWAIQGVPDREGKARPVAEAATVASVLAALREAPLTHKDAEAAVRILRGRGLLTPPRADMRDAAEFLAEFWDYDKSPYIASRLAHGLRATRRHCKDMSHRVNKIKTLLPPGLALHEITQAHLEAVGRALKAEGYAPASINKTFGAAKAAIRWAHERGIISTDPSAGVEGYSGGPVRVRGILDAAEVRALFSAPWDDERARVACLTAATTGCRLGEILALQAQDIGDGVLYVRHSYSLADGLKSTKTGKERAVPLLPTVKAALLALEATSPHPAGPTRFVFAGRKPDQPIDRNRILDGMRRALVSMHGVEWDKEPARVAILAEYSSRGIDFHSWRHFYTKHLTAKVDRSLAQKATGHATTQMLEHYAEHTDKADMQALTVAAVDAFDGII